MFQKFLSKYGLSTHLALLAAIPLALSPFLAAATLASVVFWLTALAAVWLFVEPSVRMGEHLSLARARVRRAIFLDPFFWVLLFLVVFSAIRWLNSGIGLFYDVEQAAWLVKDAVWPVLPGAAGDAGLLPFAISLVSLVLLCGIRHAIGLMARAEFGVAGAFFAGLGGGAAAICAGLGLKGYSELMATGFAESPFWASCFGVWLVIGVASGAQAESRRWVGARLPFALGVAGNAAALIFFAPPLVAAAWLVLAAGVLLFCSFYLGRAGSTGAIARYLALALFGFALPVFLLMMAMPEPVRAFKLDGLSPAVAFNEGYKETAEALSRLARAMWVRHPWTGAGLGAFGLHAQFLAEKSDWAVIPMQPQFSTNGYWMFLAERGIVGCVVLAVVLGMLLVFWGLRLARAFVFLRTQDDADIFPFAVAPVAWTAPFCLLLLAAEAFAAPLFVTPFALLALVIPPALSAAAFPKPKKAAERKTSGSST